VKLAIQACMPSIVIHPGEPHSGVNEHSSQLHDIKRLSAKPDTPLDEEWVTLRLKADCYGGNKNDWERNKQQ
jgi:hypothetical protein